MNVSLKPSPRAVLRKLSSHRIVRPDAGAIVRARGPRRLLTLIVGTLLMLPVLMNYLGAVSGEFFNGWDHFSEGLVLAKIESTTPGAIAPAAGRIGLVLAQPNPIAPYDTFNALRDGAHSTSSSYAEYRVQLGLQGFLFTGVYYAGCQTTGCLETTNAAFTAAALMGFAMLLSLIAPRALSGLFLFVSVGSPWLIGAGKNLYWSPWSFFLPAMGAICFVIARNRRGRVVAAVATLLLFALRFGMGFEFLTSISLFASSMPLLAWAFDRGRRRFRSALLDAGIVFGLSVVAFVVMFVVTCLVTNRGDLAAGINDILQHALTRTYGGYSTDPVTAMSIAASPIDVLGTYIFGWMTPVVQFGWGAPFSFAFGPNSMFPMLVGGGFVILRRWSLGDRRWRRDLTVLLTGLAAPVSWFVLAKSHSFVHTPIDYILWYLMGVTSVFWVVFAWIAEKVSLLVGRIRSALTSIEQRGNSGNIGPLTGDPRLHSAGAPASHADLVESFEPRSAAALDAAGSKTR